MPLPAGLIAAAPLIYQGARAAAPYAVKGAKHLAGHILPHLAVHGLVTGGEHLLKKGARKYKRAQDGRFTAAMMAQQGTPRVRDLVEHLEDFRKQPTGTLIENTKRTVANSPAAHLVRRLRKWKRARDGKFTASAAMAQAPGTLKAYTAKRKAATAAKRAARVARHTEGLKTHTEALKTAKTPQMQAYHTQAVKQHSAAINPPAPKPANTAQPTAGHAQRSSQAHAQQWHEKNVNHANPKIANFHRSQLEKAGTGAGASLSIEARKKIACATVPGLGTAALIGGAAIGSAAGIHYLTKKLRKPKPPHPTGMSESVGDELRDEIKSRRDYLDKAKQYKEIADDEGDHARILKKEIGMSGIGDAAVRATITVSKKMLPYVKKLCDMLGVKIIKIAKENYASDLIKSVIVIEGARRALMLLKEALTLFHRPDKQGMSFAQDVEMGLVRSVGRGVGAVARVATAPHRQAIGHIVSGPKRIVKAWKKIGHTVGEGLRGLKEGATG